MEGSQQERARQIGLKIVSARKRIGMSQEALAEALAARSGIEIDPKSIRRSLVNNETGRYAPRLRTLQAIAEITSQPLDYFVADEEAATPAAPFPGAA